MLGKELEICVPLPHAPVEDEDTLEVYIIACAVRSLRANTYTYTTEQELGTPL